MKTKSMRRIVSLILTLAMIVAVLPLLQITTGLAAPSDPITASINGAAAKSGENLEDILSSEKVPVNSILVEYGVIVQSDFDHIRETGQNSTFSSLTIDTMQDPPTISSIAVFAGCPLPRTINVPSAFVEKYITVDDGNAEDNLWYGFEIKGTGEISQPDVEEDKDAKEISEIKIDIASPVTGETPEIAVIALDDDEEDKNEFTISNTVWSESSTEIKQISGEFQQGESYIAAITLKSNDGFKFKTDADESSIIEPNVTNLTKTVEKEQDITQGKSIVRDGIKKYDTYTFVMSYDVPQEDPKEDEDTNDEDTTDEDDDTSDEETDEETINRPTPRPAPMPIARPMPIATGDEPLEGQCPHEKITDITISDLIITENEDDGSQGVPIFPIGSSPEFKATVTCEHPVKVIDVPFQAAGSISPEIPEDNDTTEIEYVPANPPNDIQEESHLEKCGYDFAENELDLEWFYSGLNEDGITYDDRTPIFTDGIKEKGLSYIIPEVMAYFHDRVYGITVQMLGDKIVKEVKIGVIDKNAPICFFTPVMINDAKTKVNLNADNFDLVVSCNPEPSPIAKYDYEWRRGREGETEAEEGEFLRGSGYATYTLSNIQATDEGWYTVKVINLENNTYDFASIFVEVTIAEGDLIPITDEDIYSFYFTSPVNGATPEYIPETYDDDEPQYTQYLTWRVANSGFGSSDSILVPSQTFLPSKVYYADVVLTAEPGYIFKPDDLGNGTLRKYMEITMQNCPGAIIDTARCTIFNDGKNARISIKFPRTINPESQDQPQLYFVNDIYTDRTYGDNDFAVLAYGGAGDGKMKYESTDENVISVETNTRGDVIAKIVGAGTAQIKVTKAAGKDEYDKYNETFIVSQTIKVRPKVLVVKAVDKTIKVNTTTDIFPIDISGFVNGDTEFNVNGFVSPTTTCKYPTLVEDEEEDTKKPDKNAVPKTPEEVLAEEQAKLDKLLGDYEIIPAGGTATPAYVFRYVPGTLTINNTGIKTDPLPKQNYIETNSPTIEDRKNGVQLTDIGEYGVFEAGTELFVENKTFQMTDEDKALYNANINLTLQGKELAQLYNIELKMDGATIQPDSNILVDIELAGNIKGRYSNLQVVYISEYGDVIAMPHALEYDKVSFVTDHLGQYAIVGSATYSVPGYETEVPQTSDCNTKLPLFLVMAIISTGVIIKLKLSKKLKF